MADVSIATPGSTAESGTPAKPSTSKDRTCPYCRTNFTSSSLGRHLDLFIKEKNPKPPDGVHDIEEIRRTRGNITRRQARTSSAKREGSVTSSTKPTPSHDKRSPSFSRHDTNGDHPDRTITSTGLIRAGWEATGVINDIPTATRDTRYDIRRDQLHRPSTKNDVAQRKKQLEERDRGRAAELALKEVLDSIKAANVRAHPTGPFAFDFFGQSFPALCLHCLSRPALISSSQLIPSHLSWPVSLPGPLQLEAIRGRVAVTLQWWRRKRRLEAESGLNGSLDSSNNQSDAESAHKEDQQHYEHLTKAYKLWSDLSEAQKKEAWHLEALRAFAREQEAHGQTQLKLHEAEQGSANLRIQLERLNECQQPREFILFPPNQFPISRETAGLVASNGNQMPLEYDQLVEKWRSRIQNNRRAQKPLPHLQSLDAPMGSHRTNGLSPYPHQAANGDLNLHNHGISDDDLIDAPGDEDDELGGQARAPTASMDRRVLDPKLREQGDEIMQGIEGDGDGDGDGFVGGRLLAGLREYEGANGRGL